MASGARERLAGLAATGSEVALVLGGNGFVGAHLVARLSREPGIRKVFATVRATAEHTAEQRLAQTLDQYRVADLDRAKVETLDADPTKTHFGLPPRRYGKLAEDVDLVFTCASSTDYTAGYLDLRDAWVKGLLRVLQFVGEVRRKHVTYLGSVGSYFYQRPADFLRPDSWWYSGYAQMKWVNSQLLGWLARDGAFSVTLCEAPYVLGSTTVGLDPGRHYSWWRIVEIARSIGVIWDGPGMGYTPVDVLVDLLTTNAMRQRPLPRLLPRNPTPYDNKLLADLLGLRTAGWTEFMAEATRLVHPARIRTMLSENCDELIRITNAPPYVLPADHDPSWCDNRRLMEMYLGNVRFRDVRMKASAPHA
ncbi:MAG: SDR family oxidoreductase [Pseudonocardiaceae bacterium]